MDRYSKRLIEVDMPIKRISAHARKEKSVRQGHVSSLHIWWARRPLAACRSVICAGLWPDPADENCPSLFRETARNLMHQWAANNINLVSQESWSRFVSFQKDPHKLSDNIELRNALLDFIADFADWENSANKYFIKTARILTQTANETLSNTQGVKPLVVDPFAGGGAIPIEALRIGTDVYASDLNPIAALLNKILVEYIPKYKHRLINEVEKWGNWIKENTKEELTRYYPNEANGTLIGYLWARTVKCEGPGCGLDVPIIKNTEISQRYGNRVAIKIDYLDGILQTKIVSGKDVGGLITGTSKRSSVTCPACGFTTNRKRVEGQSKEKGFGYHLLAVCLRSKEGARIYRQPNTQDYRILDQVDEALDSWKNTMFSDIVAVPHEELPYLRSIFNVRVYGIDEWHKLFHRRQLLSALIYTAAVRKAAEKIKNNIHDTSFASAIIECLALSVSNSFQYQCNIATYLTEGIKSAFIQGQSLPMKMDFIEANPIMNTLAGGYDYSLNQHLAGLRYCTSYEYEYGTAAQISALNIALPEDSVDLIATDPPYYDVVPYADCSDFFYVWLRRMIKGFSNVHTDTELTPKDEEIVQLAERNERYKLRTKHWFEDKLRESFLIATKTVKPSGGLIVVFAHKDTSAWEALLQAVLDAKWVITGSWPIDTEKGSRLRANESAVLSSSIHLFCRPQKSYRQLSEESVGVWRDVLSELPTRIHQWLPKLAEEGIIGADAIFACLGPALEIFSRYSLVEKASGDKVELKEYLEYVWAAVAKEALTMIFTGADATGFEEDARLTAMWLWTLRTGDSNGSENEDASEEYGEDKEEIGKKAVKGGFSLEYDAARKIAQGLGAHLESLQHIVTIQGDTATLLPVAARTQYLFGKDSAENPKGKTKKKDTQLKLDFGEELKQIEKESGTWTGDLKSGTGRTILDQLHQSMIFFGAGRTEALRRFLVEEGIGSNQLFWRLAQALSALYPTGTDEKRWVDGVLARKKSFGF